MSIETFAPVPGVHYRGRAVIEHDEDDREDISVETWPETESARALRLPDQAVSPKFRTAMFDQFPALKNPAYAKLACYLIFTAGKKGREILVPGRLLAMMEGKTYDPNYCAGKFLRAFQEHVVLLNIAEAEYVNNRCRAVKRVYWPPEIKALIDAELRTKSSEKVKFVSGAKWRREDDVKERKMIHSIALEAIEADKTHPARRLLDLLNNAPSNRFCCLRKHLDTAHALIDTLPYDHLMEGTGGADLWDDELEAMQFNIEMERERQHAILRALDQQPQPVYSPGEKSARVFAINDSLCSLQRDARKVVTQDWTACDLRSAQLAIVAKTWDVPLVTEFLRSGASIWPELCSWMQIDISLKPVVKKALYALMFGSGRDKMIAILGTQGYERFSRHRLIHALLSARKVQLAKIREAGGGTDAYGRWMGIEYREVPGKAYHYDNSRKILALIAQSYELALLQPVIDLAWECKDQKHGFVICSWLHDGFCFDCLQEDRNRWTLKLQTAVQERADNLGIGTRLEVE